MASASRSHHTRRLATCFWGQDHTASGSLERCWRMHQRQAAKTAESNRRGKTTPFPMPFNLMYSWSKARYERPKDLGPSRGWIQQSLLGTCDIYHRQDRTKKLTKLTSPGGPCAPGLLVTHPVILRVTEAHTPLFSTSGPTPETAASLPAVHSGSRLSSGGLRMGFPLPSPHNRKTSLILPDNTPDADLSSLRALYGLGFRV